MRDKDAEFKRPRQTGWAKASDSENVNELGAGCAISQCFSKAVWLGNYKKNTCFSSPTRSLKLIHVCLHMWCLPKAGLAPL